MIVDRLTAAYQTARALAAVVEDLGASLPLDAAAALACRRAVHTVAAVLAPRITTQADVALIGRALAEAVAALSPGVEPEAAAPAFAAAALAAPRFASPARNRAAALGRALAGCVEAACLGQGFLAEARRAYPDRPSALAGRARVAAALEGATDRIAAAAGPEVFGVLARVAAAVSDHVATVATDLRPVVGVETPRSAPSTALAWALYGDPARAPELVARNAVACRLFMPTRLEALDPQA